MTKKTISPGQQRARDSFKAAVDFLTPLHGLVKKGYGELARRKKSLAAGLALGHTLQVAIGLRPEGPVVDPALVRLSDGSLPGIRVERLIRHPDRFELVHDGFCDAPFSGDDRLILCAYQVEKGYAFVNERIWQRQEGRVVVPIPEGFRSDGFHLYVLLSDRKELRYARSNYLGYSTV